MYKNKFMVIGRSTEKGDIYFGGIYNTEDEANARLDFIKENFSGYKSGKEEWKVQGWSVKQPINFNCFMVIKFEE